MKALVSGQAALAVLVDGDDISSIALDEESPTPRSEWEIPLLLADADDVTELRETTVKGTVDQLEAAWRNDRTYRLLLLLLDASHGDAFRSECADCIAELLAAGGSLEFAADRLYSFPLPRSADLAGVLAIASKREGPLAEFLRDLLHDQPAIAERHSAWTKLPYELFGGPQEKAAFYSVATVAGACKLFVRNRERGDWALFQLLADVRFRGNPQAREVFQAWAKPFRSSVTGRDFRLAAESQQQNAEDERVPKRRRRTANREAFESAEKQLEAIREHLLAGHYEVAHRYIQELVEAQRKSSETRHIAMSLCSIAQFAKQLGDYELQRDLSEWAAREDPTDPWPHAQAGDAFRLMGNFDRALDEYHRAGAAGDERVALLGRAEVLKDLGELNEALQVYDKCVELYPTDLICKNARAAALASFGRLDEALASYDAILAGVSLEPVTMGGRAQVLRDLGQVDEALARLEELATIYPNEPITQQMRAEVYRDLGKFAEALRVLDRLISEASVGIGPRNSRAKVLREMGQYDAAVAEYRHLIASFPKDVAAYVGLAEVFRKAGRVSEAIEAYRAAESRFPRMGMARTGLAAVLASQGHYSEAMKLLPTEPPATQSEWVAFHIKCMIHLRSKEFATASTMLEWGVSTTPWTTQRRYFETALASLRIRQKRFEAALRLLEVPPPSILRPVVEVLRLHAYGEMGRRADVVAAEESLTLSVSPVVVELRSELLRRFSRASDVGTGHTDDWVLERECDSLLLAA